MKRFLLPIGMLFFAATLMINHYFSLPDFFAGLLHGIGIGLILWGAIRQLKSLRTKLH